MPVIIYDFDYIIWLFHCIDQIYLTIWYDLVKCNMVAKKMLDIACMSDPIFTIIWCNSAECSE